jgi:NAD(P)-dependent dehydrogenase (short-subunit alcohol dehydrogenase family)
MKNKILKKSILKKSVFLKTLLLSNINTIFIFALFYSFIAQPIHSHNKTILIIGGSSGIGKALVAAYSESNNSVYATFNNTNPDDRSKNVIYIKADLLSEKSIDKIVNSVKGRMFDVIIYNAGKFGYLSNKGPVLDRQDWIDSFVINAIAPIQLAFAVEKLMAKGGKYVVITSRRGSNSTNIQDQYDGRYSYRSSKSALNSALVALARDFREKKITVLMLHPGQVKTQMTEYKGMEPNQSAAMIKNTISSASFTDTGKLIDVQNNREIPW